MDNDNENLCLIETKNNSLKYTVYKKLLDSPKKNKITDNSHILDFIKKDFNFNKEEIEKYKIK